MLDVFLFETAQLVEQLEQNVIDSEKCNDYNSEEINEIFRIVHSIKGAAAMMEFDNMAHLAHGIEDVFFYLRESSPVEVDCHGLCDLILASVDFFKKELEKLKDGEEADDDATSLIDTAENFLTTLKRTNSQKQTNSQERQSAQTSDPLVGAPSVPHSESVEGDESAEQSYKATVFFEDNCMMENIRAYTVLTNLQGVVEQLVSIPENVMEDDSTAEIIRKNGFKVSFISERSYDEIHELLEKTVFLKSLNLEKADTTATTQGKARPKEIILDENPVKEAKKETKAILPAKIKTAVSGHGHSNDMIGVSVTKLDVLLNLVGELVVAEAMVVQNPDLRGLSLDNFAKSARQLEKITREMQDTVMALRMLPLAATFHKMERVVRDISKKMGKEIHLQLVGEETEVDKNIIEHISDPLIHIIRNAADHGVETREERIQSGKPAVGTILLQAKHEGNDVVILIKDNGRGLDRDKILQRARQNGLLHKPEDALTDKEVYSFIFVPGFSTNDQVTEFSGRGVGMDVVTKNINSIGGTVIIDSLPGQGTTVALKIPLTLAIIEAMTIRVGKSRYTLPITAIKESFKPQNQDIITDPDGNEMVMVRGQCYPILRLGRLFRVSDAATDFTDGIIIMVENESRIVCLFADELIGEQQVVVKALPSYIQNIRRVEGLAGCTLLGDGTISLILDIGGLIRRAQQ